MAEAAPASHAVHHEAPTGFIRKWVFSTDHKIIGIQYYFLALFSVLVGMTLSIFIRFNLAWPGTEIPLLETLFPVGAPGGGPLGCFRTGVAALLGLASGPSLFDGLGQGRRNGSARTRLHIVSPNTVHLSPGESINTSR